LKFRSNTAGWLLFNQEQNTSNVENNFFIQQPLKMISNLVN